MRFRFIARLLPPFVEPRRVWSVTFSMVKLERNEMPLMLIRDVQTGMMTPHLATKVEFVEPREVEAILYAVSPAHGEVPHSVLVDLVDAAAAAVPGVPDGVLPVAHTSAEAFDEMTARYRRPRG